LAVALRGLAIMALAWSMQWQNELAPAEIAMAAAAFAIITAGELGVACRRLSEERVWTAAGVKTMTTTRTNNG
jgi:hypothetical protein